MLFQTYILVALSFWIILSFWLILGRRKIRSLNKLQAPASFTEPEVVIILAVRNEQEKIGATLEALCRLNYSHYRILVADDRSTDGTSAIISDLVQKHARISQISPGILPSGWLGKNYALYTAYRHTSEEWLLFTDADVVYEPDSLRTIMYDVSCNGQDHVTVMPGIHTRSSWLNAALFSFFTLLEAKQRPWKAGVEGSGAFMGLGAFNLVRRSIYEKSGTHRSLALRPNDDLELGKNIRQAGGKQEYLYGLGLIGQEWYHSMAGFIRGLEKTSFSSYGYNVPAVLFSAVLPTLLLIVLPLPLSLLSGTPENITAGILMLLSMLCITLTFRGMSVHWWYALLIPWSGLLLAYTLANSMVRTLLQKGIYWRDRFYPLSELKGD